jgi:hypothetical protein
MPRWGAPTTCESSRWFCILLYTAWSHLNASVAAIDHRTNHGHLSCLLNPFPLPLSSFLPQWGFKHADRTGSAFAVLIGSEEAAQGFVTIKEMATGAQEKLAVADLPAWIQARRQL